jgi:serine/threonine-protein phosphatase CPPED1
MKKLLLSLAAVGCVASVTLFSTARPEKAVDANASAFVVATAAKNPWTNLTPNVDPEQFQFAIVSDRTGGHRKGVFSKAVQQVNLLQPEFVMSVGDLIEGSGEADVNRKQWDEFDKYAKQFQMPFFYCAGNHDNGTKPKNEVWSERLGRSYFHFVYKNCLFLILNSNDAEPAPNPNPAQRFFGRTGFSKVQQEYATKAIKENAGVRWTFVFMHHPVWAGRDLTETGMLEIEKALEGRKYNVFCGHVHNFRKFLRNGTAYYQLATTGGGSAMRGVEYGEFDQTCWVTVKKDGPLYAHVNLEGVMKEDLVPFTSEEDGSVAPKSDGLTMVSGTVTIAGKAVSGLQVSLTEIRGDAAPKDPPAGAPLPRVASYNSRVSVDGAFTMYANRGAPGVRAGKYAVTIDLAPSLVIDPKAMPENPVPEKYRKLNTTPLRIEVKKDEPLKLDFKLEQ